MNILFTLNDAFVPQVATCMCSIFENNKSADSINIYLIGEKISEKNQQELSAFTNKYKRNVYFIELGNIEDLLDFEFDTNGWSPIVLARLFLDKLLPNDVNRVLYLDGDTIVLKDISKFYSTDLEDKVLGMCPEPTVDKTRKKFLKLGEYPYHNSGVLLIDLNKWREKQIGKQVIEFYRQHDGNLFAPDQDALNGSLKLEIKTLSLNFNYFNIYDTYPYYILKKLSFPTEFISKSEFESIKKSPSIIHYLGEERPWRKGNTHKWRGEYLHYLSTTPWKDTPMEEGWQLYFICFRIFNTIMRPFPMLRYKIINSLIPSFMKYRKKQLQKKQK
ncbi:General stress protein A [Streptococcus intermedius]|uniref:Glycosyltransferase family 8 protein n=1 Tax=Streptococcus periodonticum TaxID=2490633 RepID=A0A3Q9F345_9STRE|nr:MULTISPECIES: glycosyltransferase family 8 protein [Streptococcus]AZQ41512.1 glycosyltransferase family 8 protein [Streptococcus periodonticum]MCI3917271.1 glycosyltransferase family 8 protein [Streptococcus intermedius]RSJ11371.1 General stress protein A [Streptococcus intermedius]RSJ17490.1 General stress protein A [Streptococcus intermedius]RSJ32665.1 General stress protein A [Streptococcus intermedius]